MTESGKIPDLRKEEAVEVTCAECGIKYTGWRVTNRSGRVYEPNQICQDCASKKRLTQYMEMAEAGLADEVSKQKKRWSAELEIPDIFQDKARKFETFDSKLQPRAYNVIKGFSGRSIILASPDVYGVGKTHLVCTLARHLIDTTEAVRIRPDGRYQRYMCPVQFVTETALLSRIRDTYDQRSEIRENEIYNRLSSYELLIIDDVGKTRPKDLSFLQSVYFRIIDDRYTHRQSIVLTTNLSLSDLEIHIGGASADRLKEMCGRDNIVIMSGKSYRTVNSDRGEFTPKPEVRRWN